MTIRDIAPRFAAKAQFCIALLILNVADYAELIDTQQESEPLYLTGRTGGDETSHFASKTNAHGFRQMGTLETPSE